jgi:hypothetical protein
MSNCKLAAAYLPYRPSPLPTAEAQFNADAAPKCVQAAARYDCSNGQILEDCSFVFTGPVTIGGGLPAITRA